MQLALSLSKEEHDKEERLRRGDDLRLQMAIEESQRHTEVQTGQGESSLMDLADVFAPQAAPSPSDPWGAPSHPPAASPAPLPDPWGLPTADPWGVPRQVPLLPPSSSGDAWGGSVVPGRPVPPSDSWDASGTQPTLPVPAESWAPLPAPASQPPPSLDPWAPLAAPKSETLPPTAGLPSYETLDAKADEDEFAEFDALRAPPIAQDTSAVEPNLLAGEVPALRVEGGNAPDLFDISPAVQTPVPAARKTPESFLGPNAALVDLDALVSNNVKSCNPFLATGGTTPSSGSNPFGPSSQSLSLNQLRASPVLCPSSGTATPPPLLLLPVPAPHPLVSHTPTTTTSTSSPSTTNPFLL
ncbi:epsin-1-like [Hemiscyllium ocellatum]|uniref:epsin-1-like n=1 Tax=Hemiscyllium ocellatum TaxID=170820 RepID=UPI0029672CEF|nr:epsin-1-like [Hemiscyllium ocellatum]